MSLTFGFAGGLLLGAVALDMLPLALEMGGLEVALLGFSAGYGAIYLIDLLVHRGQLAGEKSEMFGAVRRMHRRRGIGAAEATVLATATSAEELLEGIAIGIGAAIDPQLALLVATATAADNVSEAFNIGQLYRDEDQGEARISRKIIGWTALIGLNDVLGAGLGWWLFRDAAPELLGLVFAGAAGGMFYIAITDLVPIAQARHYQQSAGWATASGFVLALIFAHLS